MLQLNPNCPAILNLNPSSFYFTACLPFLLEQGQITEEPRVTFCPAALAEDGQPGSSGSITWNGDLTKMAR